MPISLLWHDVNKLIYAGHFLTTTFDLDVDGSVERVIPRDYQLDPIKDKPLHVDFLRIKAGSKITVEIPVHVANDDAAPWPEGRRRHQPRASHALELRVSADAIPGQRHGRHHRPGDRRFGSHEPAQTAARQPASPRPARTSPSSPSRRRWKRVVETEAPETVAVPSEAGSAEDDPAKAEGEEAGDK